MPNMWANVDNNFPTFTDEEDVKQQLKKLHSYMYALTEELKYSLNNISTANWNDAALNDYSTEFTAQTQAVDGRVDKANGRIDAQAERIDELMADLVEAQQQAQLLTMMLEGKQNKLTAGAGITITEDNVISSSGGGGGGAVSSVNGQTGAVVLDAEDVGALPDSTVIPEAPFYWCTYGTTTYAEITAALEAGKIPVCKMDYASATPDCIFVYAAKTSTYYYLHTASYNTIYYIRVNASNTWSKGGTTVQSTSNLKTSISSASTDSQYPSAKCVYDELQAKQPKLTAGAGITITEDNVISSTGGGGGGAVSSVNGQTGAVVLDAEDVGALPDSTVIPQEQLFWCTYGSTTYAEITAALEAGKLPMCKVDYSTSATGTIFKYATKNSSYYYFEARYNTSICYLRVNTSNTWSKSGSTAQTTGNLKTAISSASTDSQYPSAKCVYTELQGKQAAVTLTDFKSDLTGDLNAYGGYTAQCADYGAFKHVLINYCSGNNNHNSGATLFTIPEGYRPQELYYIPFGGHTSQGILSVGTDGTVKVVTLSPNPATNYIAAHIEYYITVT